MTLVVAMDEQLDDALSGSRLVKPTILSSAIVESVGVEPTLTLRRCIFGRVLAEGATVGRTDGSSTQLWPLS